MIININAVCRKDKMYKNGTAPIHIRFTLNRKIRYASTGLSILLNDWDFENQRVKVIFFYYAKNSKAYFSLAAFFIAVTKHLYVLS